MEAITRLIESGYPPAIVVVILCFVIYLKFYNNIKGEKAKIIIGLVAFVVIPLSTYYLTVQPKDYPVSEDGNNNVTKLLCERVQFSRGTISKILQGKLYKGEEKCYKLRINAGQKLIVNINQNFDIRIVAPGGEVIAPEFISEGKWIGELPISGDYLMIVKGNGNYTIQVTIPAKKSDKTLHLTVIPLALHSGR